MEIEKLDRVVVYVDDLKQSEDKALFERMLATASPASPTTPALRRRPARAQAEACRVRSVSRSAASASS